MVTTPAHVRCRREALARADEVMDAAMQTKYEISCAAGEPHHDVPGPPADGPSGRDRSALQADGVHPVGHCRRSTPGAADCVVDFTGSGLCSDGGGSADASRLRSRR
jgi:hypothetical protein